MIKAIGAIAILVTPISASAQSTQDVEAAIQRANSARSLLETCTLDGLYGPLACNAYFLGFTHASQAYEALGNQRPLHCFIPRGTGGFAGFIVPYLRAHPELLDEPMGPVVLRALRSEFPCSA